MHILGISLRLKNSLEDFEQFFLTKQGFLASKRYKTILGSQIPVKTGGFKLRVIFIRKSYF